MKLIDIARIAKIIIELFLKDERNGNKKYASIFK